MNDQLGHTSWEFIYVRATVKHIWKLNYKFVSWLRMCMSIGNHDWLYLDSPLTVTGPGSTLALNNETSGYTLSCQTKNGMYKVWSEGQIITFSIIWNYIHTVKKEHLTLKHGSDLKSKNKLNWTLQQKTKNIK